MSDDLSWNEAHTPGVSSTGRRVARILVTVMIAALAVLALLRVFIPPVAPTQDPPSGHPAFTCSVCHIVSESIDEMEVP